ncbi:helix-turn-helix domain-containing protein [Burkholderia vietnamiensis]|uniref:helix-turn-helix domain-containing protein n=2 Tax=Burkholderia vietnamiensis TaxID=60552 RepID=UPI001E31760B|nr:helix-turn-helix transcriptional regulator [Burkholderia vietnamiensis]MDN7929117.1 helix-turn-helix transcriptional regulator [Burkholderia vietnamiensis]
MLASLGDVGVVARCNGGFDSGWLKLPFFKKASTLVRRGALAFAAACACERFDARKIERYPDNARFYEHGLAFPRALTMMLVLSSIRAIRLDLSSMKVNQEMAASPAVLAETKHLGQLLSRLRIARGVHQSEAATRAGLSRNTAYRIEKGDPGVAIGQVIRYLEAFAPGLRLHDLLSETDPALKSLDARTRRQRVSVLSEKELKELDF